MKRIYIIIIAAIEFFFAIISLITEESAPERQSAPSTGRQSVILDYPTYEHEPSTEQEPFLQSPD
jgi:hypothetical protein